ncbi:SAV_2336 N-terminal domain-related protein [Streptomyces mesophilus]|uniref:SAV_2336 N-terminal domain-related protein n=1 Tax=Streptomyces mesophilus TaxID=1775132 RepID=UPI00332B8790
MLAEAGGREDADAGPTSVELAELLWLARQMRVPEPDPPTPPHPQPRTPDGTPPGHAPPPPPDHSPKPAPPPPAPPRVPVHLPDPAPGPEHPRDTPAADNGTYTTLLAPAPPMLPRPLTLQRALRPLKRRVPAPTGVELDETATAERIARLSAPPQWWLPVLRPAQERWLRLRIVYDDGPTMPVWRPLLRELRTVFGQSGIFRTLDVHHLSASGAVRGAEGTPADGRTVTLVVSDCMGPQWRDGSAGRRWYATLNRWASRHPVAVVQPLPERLWRTTALPATPTALSSPWPAAPNSAYSTADPDAEGLIVPVLEPSAPWLANWAALVSGGGPVPGAVAALAPTPPPAPLDEAGRTDVQQLGPEELLLRFRSIASPEAFRLAGHLAVGRPHLPYMRLVQAALEPRPQPGHLAEVILSGLLRAVPGAAGSYVFREGVRELLLGTLPRTSRLRTRDLLARLGAPIDDRAGVVAGEMRVAVPGGSERGVGGAEVASVRAESVRRLGGPVPDTEQSAGTGLFAGRYAYLGRLGSETRQTWRARDTATDRTVVLRLFPGLRPGSTEGRAFADRAGTLALVDHPNVAALLDYGFASDAAYATEEYVGGVSLGDVMRGARGPLPFWLLARLAAHTARALAAIRSRGLGHGPLRPADVLIDPSDGAVKLTGFLDRTRARPPLEDPAHLNAMLKELAGPTSFSPWSLTDWQVLSGVQPVTRDIDRTPDEVISLLTSPEFEPITQRAAAQAPQFQLIGTQLCPGADQLSPDTLACLVVLLERYGRSVPGVEIASGLEERPRTAEEFHHHLDELMRVLGPGVIASGLAGYAVVACPAQIDVHAIRAVVDRSGDPRNTDDTRTRRSMIQSALDAFEDEPLAGIPGPAARRMRATLRALRLQLLVTRTEADLDLGRHEQAATDLTQLLTEHPDHPDFRRLHMLALRSLGRIGDAIESYEQYRERIDDPHPDPDLVALHDELYRELLAAPERDRSAVVFEFLAETPDDNERAQYVIGRFVGGLLSRDILAPDAHELLARTNGYLVITDPGTSVLPLLPTLITELPTVRRQLPPQVSLRVMLWHNARPVGHLGPSSLAQQMAPVPGDALVILSPPLYEEALSGVAPFPAGGFTPLSERGEVVAYVHWVAPEPAPAGSPDGPKVVTHPGAGLRVSSGHETELVRDLVRGPFSVHGAEIPAVDAATTAVVYIDDEQQQGAFGFDENDVTRYYEVDLTPHQEWRELPLPSAASLPFTAAVELSWQVTDPIAYVHSETAFVATTLFEHVSRLLSPITRRYTVARLGAAQLAVQQAHFEPWPIPGLHVAHAIRLSTTPPPAQGAGPAQGVGPAQGTGPAPDPLPDQHLGDQLAALLDGELNHAARERVLAHLATCAQCRAEVDAQRRLKATLTGAAPATTPSETFLARLHGLPNIGTSEAERPPVAGLLARARTVLLGFEGPVVHLYAGHAAREVSRQLADLIVELRRPDESLRGDRLLKGTNLRQYEGHRHPLDLLRALGDHRVAAPVAERLTQLELNAAANTFPTPHVDQLIRTLHAGSRRVGIVTDVAAVAVSTYLDSRGLSGTLRAGVYGRGPDLTRLMPHPECLLRALDANGSTPDQALLITSSPAEIEAADTAGIPTIGYARDERTRSRLESADCPTLIPNLSPLLEAAREAARPPM